MMKGCSAIERPLEGGRAATLLRRHANTSGSCQLNDVLYFQNLFRIAFANSVDHGQPHYLQGTKACRVKRSTNGIEPGKKLVVTFHILLARRSFHKGGTEHIGRFEQPHQSIFSSAFYARPG